MREPNDPSMGLGAPTRTTLLGGGRGRQLPFQVNSWIEQRTVRPKGGA